MARNHCLRDNVTMNSWKSRRTLPLFFAALLAFSTPLPAADPNKSPPDGPLYENRADHDPNGIGKFYMGREIAHVMGHQAADWLERPERDAEEKPELLLAGLKLKPGDIVADIGAGTGYFSWRMAKLVGERGTVYAVEIQQEMIDLLNTNMAQRKVTNVKPVLGTISDPKLPANSLDLVIMVDVYHEFSHPYEMMEAICRSLKPGGRVAFVEYRTEDPSVPIKRAHKMSEAQVRKEVERHPLTWVETNGTLPRQHLIIFRKQQPGGEAQSPRRSNPEKNSP
jgi:precorrin-6B methylase 2